MVYKGEKKIKRKFLIELFKNLFKRRKKDAIHKKS